MRRTIKEKDSRAAGPEAADTQQGASPLGSASYMKLVRMRFGKNKLAVVSLFVLAIVYLLALFAPFVAPYNRDTYNKDYVFHPPHRIRFFSDEGFHLRPFVYEYEKSLNAETFQYEYNPTGKRYPLYLFVRGDAYTVMGDIESRMHLFGTKEGQVFLLGADNLGRDMLTRILYGARISTSIGLIGVLLSAFLGVTIGGIAGLLGGVVDTVIQRLIEVLRSIPTLPLWMGLAAALPPSTSPVTQYFLITIILSLLAWTRVGRVCRSAFMSIRSDDYITVARLAGGGTGRIIFRHMLPNFASYIIAQLTLSIPLMIIGETTLSFIGVGLRDPVISWGVLLQRAQQISVLVSAPWLLLPGLAVVITVLAFNFVGDGLRDAADPYNE